MLVAIYTKGNQINKSIIYNMDDFEAWCKQYKPREVWVLDTQESEIKYHFVIETQIVIRGLNK